MPLYEYQCESCGVRFEVIQKFADAPVATCKACGGTVRRLLSAPAIQFKGTGWYITDYARKGSSGSEPGTSPAATGAAGDKPAAASDSSGSTSSGSTSSGSGTPATSTTANSEKK